MAQKNETAETTPRKNRQVQGTIPAEVYDDLEGYAFGTRRKLTKVVSDIVLEYYEANKAEIQERARLTAS